jgi:hypothetical protein
MLKKIGALSACGLLAAILGAAPANAAVVVYSGYDVSATNLSNKPNADAAHNAYLAATAGLAETFLATFEGAPLGNTTSFNLGGGGTMTGAANGGVPQVFRNALQCQYALCGGNTTVGGNTYLGIVGGNVTFTFARPIQAFGAYFVGAQVPGMTLTFNDGSSQAIDVPGFFGADYVGFTDFGRSISQVTFNARSDIMAIDDVTFSLASAAPEPASWALMIGGFGLAGCALRTRRQMLSA